MYPSEYILAKPVANKPEKSHIHIYSKISDIIKNLVIIDNTHLQY